mmetsp:Transcript_5192/g.9353  ORF Transcript_5192/g.9353 Transcript_5192/m.9353 type:complete len:102 (-) Transcript_5192:132-437(-)
MGQCLQPSTAQEVSWSSPLGRNEEAFRAYQNESASRKPEATAKPSKLRTEAPKTGKIALKASGKRAGAGGWNLKRGTAKAQADSSNAQVAVVGPDADWNQG